MFHSAFINSTLVQTFNRTSLQPRSKRSRMAPTQPTIKTPSASITHSWKRCSRPAKQNARQLQKDKHPAYSSSVSAPETSSSFSNIHLLLTFFFVVITISLFPLSPANSNSNSNTSSISTEIIGHAHAVDGDTIIVYQNGHKYRIRLRAIDAPEMAQKCIQKSNNAALSCGITAKDATQSLLDSANGIVRCIPSSKPDRYGRTVATCSVKNGIDIGASLVSDGLAVAYRQYGKDYVQIEDEARASNRGVWATEFEMPWNWRRAHRNK